jgi:UDP-glucose 4-epimerase
MKVAVAGASGLVGHGVATALRAAGHDVVTVGRRPDCGIVLDLARPAKLAPGAFAGCDAIVHAAGVIDEDFATPASAQSKASEGTRALMTAALAGGVTRAVYFSSAHVYGPLEGDIDETHALDPRSDYARAHRASEVIVREESKRTGAASLVVRPCAVYGPLAHPASFARWSLIPFDFPRQGVTGRIVLRSAGVQRRNFVSSTALGLLVRAWLDSADRSEATANAPGIDELSVYDFALLCARIVREEAGIDCRVERPAGTQPEGKPFRYLTRREPLPASQRVEDHVRDLVHILLKKDPQ